MTDRDTIMVKVVAAIADAFLVDPQSLKPETTAVDVPGWDSVSQVGLVMQLEDAFGIEIGTTVLGSLPDIASLADYIAGRVNSR